MGAGIGMNSTIVRAMQDKRCLSFFYDGFYRTVEPHVYGLGKDDQELLLGYQISGGHASAHKEPWHWFSVSKISSLGVSGGFRGARGDYRRGAHALTTVFAEF